MSTSLSDALFIASYISRPICICSVGTADHGKLTADSHACIPRCGKAPPVDPFTAVDIGITFDDWLPILKQTAIWNEWTPAEESLMQLASHLKGREHCKGGSYYCQKKRKIIRLAIGCYKST